MEIEIIIVVHEKQLLAISLGDKMTTTQLRIFSFTINIYISLVGPNDYSLGVSNHL